MNYSKSFIHGMSWMGFVKFFTKFLSVIKVAIIARLLSAADLGLFGIATVALSFTEVFTETGINTFLIQQKTDWEKYVDTAWIIAIVRGVIICCIVLGSALVLPNFYKEPALFSLLIISSAIPFIKGFINPSIIRFYKELEFSKEATLRSFLTFADLVLSVAFVFMFRTPAALVVSLIACAMLEVGISHIYIHPKPHLRFDRKRFSQIFSFGKWINTTTIFNFLAKNADDMIVGKLLGMEVLGYYQIAYKIIQTVTGEFGDLVSKTLMPIFAKLKEKPRQLRQAFLRISGIMAVLLLPPIFIFMTFAPQFITIGIGEQWLPVIPVLPWLFAAAYVYALNCLTAPLFVSLNYAKYGAILLIFEVIVMVTALIPFSLSQGLVGTGIAIFISRAAVQPLVVLFLIHLLVLKQQNE